MFISESDTFIVIGDKNNDLYIEHNTSPRKMLIGKHENDASLYFQQGLINISESKK